MRIVIVTDAWHPQVNGVVTTLNRTCEGLEARGHSVHIVNPSDYRTVPCPSYPEIRLALRPGRKLVDTIDNVAPDAIHIATEGPLGIAARRYCLKRKLRFTTSYHTQFPQYLRKRLPVPERWSYAWLRRYHSRAERTLVPTEHQRRDLVDHGFDNVVIWSRGVDTELFQPLGRSFLKLPRPIAIYVGRVAVEKNLEAFLDLDLPGSKLIVGDGPDLEKLRMKYPKARFVGYKFGEELAQHLSSADVFVFPSRTDTFGLVMLEAMACGTPVAAYPVTGPIDVVEDGFSGCLDMNLGRAVQRALMLWREDCRAAALKRTWDKATLQFMSHLARADGSGALFPNPLVTSAPPLAVPREKLMAQATARHILVDTEEACEALKSEIENGGDFASLAREHSNCPSGGRGGDLGSFGPGMMVPEFDKVVFSAPVNAVQGPVRTQFGFHLIEVTSRDE